MVQHFVFFQEQTLEQHRLDSGKVEMIQLDELAQVLFERVGAGIIWLKFFYVVFFAIHDAPTVKRDGTDFGREIPLRDLTSMRHSFPYIGFGFACWRESLKDV